MKFEFAERCDLAGWLCWLESHPGLAAWFQVPALALTLAVALFVARIPLVYRTRELRRERRQQLFAAVEAASMVEAAIQVLARDLAMTHEGYNSFIPETNLRHIEHAEEAVLALPFSITGDPYANPAIAHVRLNARSARALIADREKFIGKAMGMPGMVVSAKHLLEVATDNSTRLIELRDAATKETWLTRLADWFR